MCLFACLCVCLCVEVRRKLANPLAIPLPIPSMQFPCVLWLYCTNEVGFPPSIASATCSTFESITWYYIFQQISDEKHNLDK